MLHPTAASHGHALLAQNFVDYEVPCSEKEKEYPSGCSTENAGCHGLAAKDGIHFKLHVFSSTVPLTARV